MSTLAPGARSANGLPVLDYGSSLLYTWVIPAKTGAVTIRLRNGSVGFLIALFLLWLAEAIEPLKGPVLDDWGHAIRPVRGQTSGYSNHASGSAADANATRHPLGKVGTFRYTVRGLLAELRIRAYLRLVLRGVLRWGGDYRNRKDEMHIEVADGVGIAGAERAARRLMTRGRGRRLLEANPSQRRVILS